MGLRAGGPAGILGFGAGGSAGGPGFGAGGRAGAGPGAPSEVRPPARVGGGGSAARSLKHTGLVGRVRPSVLPVPTSTLCWHTSEPGSPGGSVSLSVRLPALGGVAVDAVSPGAARPSTLTQVTTSRSPSGQSLGSQPMVTDIGSPDGPSPTTGPPPGPRSPKFA